MIQLIPITSFEAPALIAVAGDQARKRFYEFFTANIRNPHTRRAYARSVGEFLAWCERVRIPSIADVQPVHVATYIEKLLKEKRAEIEAELSAPSVKHQLAAIRHLFDWLALPSTSPARLRFVVMDLMAFRVPTAPSAQGWRR
jgi:site-specific recombinase XerD